MTVSPQMSVKAGLLNDDQFTRFTFGASFCQFEMSKASFNGESANVTEKKVLMRNSISILFPIYPTVSMFSLQRAFCCWLFYCCNDFNNIQMSIYGFR